MAVVERPTPDALAADRLLWAPAHACTTCGNAPAPAGIVVDPGALAEIQAFVRELRPMLDQLRELEARWTELQPFLAELRPVLAQVGAVAKGGAPELLAYLLGRRPAPPPPLSPHRPETSAHNPRRR